MFLAFIGTLEHWNGLYVNGSELMYINPRHASCQASAMHRCCLVFEGSSAVPLLWEKKPCICTDLAGSVRFLLTQKTHEVEEQ